MDHKKKERLKTCILVILVFSSILQVGILSSYGGRGFPVDYFQVFSRTPVIPQSEMDERAREEYFVPFRVVVYGGIGDLRWVIGMENEYYNQLWDEAKYYTREVLKSADLIEIDVGMWDSLIHKKTIIFEMRDELPLSLVEWFLDFKANNKTGIQGVHKIMISPDESFYRQINTVYILSGNALYRAEIAYPAGGMVSRSDYYDMMESLKSDESMDTYRAFGATGYPYEIPSDLLGSFSKFKRLRHVNYKIPDKISDIEYLTSVLLDEYRESYDRSVIDNGIYVFQTLSKMFRVYGEDGMLEYQYTGRINHNTGRDVGRIFSMVYRFITPKGAGLVPEEEMYLHGVKAIDNTSYRFEFGYRIGDYPVYIQYGNTLSPGLVVEATEDQILYCKWMFREISFDRVSANYNNNFLTLLDEIKKIHELDPNEMCFSNEGYVLYPDNRSSLEPVWIVSTENGDLYSIPMQREGVD